jgi:hypothetical protein
MGTFTLIKGKSRNFAPNLLEKGVVSGTNALEILYADGLALLDNLN